MEITNVIKKNQVVLLMFKTSPDKTMLKLCKHFSNKCIGIILYSNPAELVLQRLEDNHIDNSKILLLDCICGKGKESKNIIYTSGPEALTELSIVISEFLKFKNIDLIICDTISSMLIHNKDITLVRFIHDLVSKVRKTNKKLVLTMLAKDNKGALASIPLFVDAVVEVP